MREYKSGVTHSNTVPVKRQEAVSHLDTQLATMAGIKESSGLFVDDGKAKANECRESSRGDSEPFDKSQCDRVKTGNLMHIKQIDQSYISVKSYLLDVAGLTGENSKKVRVFMTHCNTCGKDFEDREVVK